MSEHSLTSPRRGFVDADLLGDWAYEGSPETLAVSISRQDDRTMEVRWYIEETREYFVMTGFVSEVDGRTHANLQFVGAGCDDCTDEEAAQFRENFDRDFRKIVPHDPDNQCTWATVSYQHLDDGRIRIATLGPRAVLELIEAGELQGEYDEDANGSLASDLVCITEPRRKLRRFIDGLAFDGPLTDSELLVRYGD